MDGTFYRNCIEISIPDCERIEGLEYEIRTGRRIVEYIKKHDLPNLDYYNRIYLEKQVTKDAFLWELAEKYYPGRSVDNLFVNTKEQRLYACVLGGNADGSEHTWKPVKCGLKESPEQYNDFVDRVFPDPDRRVRGVSLQVTDGCNLACKYCYQHNKQHHVMTFEIAKKFIDLLLAGENAYFNFDNTRGIMLDFIGGEPLIAIKLIRQVADYTIQKMIQEKHPWLEYFMLNICTNGVLYFTPDVQSFLREYSGWLSLSVSIDGNRELHDACRVFPDGSGSYDIAVGAALHYMKHFGEPGSKMTISPQNVPYIADAIWNLMNLGYTFIHANCVYEEGWQNEHATTLYYQLKTLADAMLRSGRWETVYVSIFDEESFVPMDYSIEDKNWCGGNGEMLAVDWKGDLYPCIRYMESSLGPDREPIIIGTVDGGLEVTDKQKQWVKCLQCITTTSQSTKECIECPIARGCGVCSGYQYEKFGDANHRATYICCTHKARALASVYFFNKWYRMMGKDKRKKCYVPRDWALEIIPEDEYEMLLELAKEGQGAGGNA